MKYYLYSIVSGLLFGLSGIILKILLERNFSFYMFIFNPLFLLSSILSISASVISQIALKNMKGSNAVLTLTITAIITSIIGGNLLGEVINTYEILGIILLTGSIVFLLLKSEMSLERDLNP